MKPMVEDEYLIFLDKPAEVWTRVFFSNGAVHICETNPLIGRMNFLMQLGDFEHHPIIPSHDDIVKGCFLWPWPQMMYVDPAT